MLFAAPDPMHEKDSRETLRLPGVFNLYAVWGRVRLLGHLVKFLSESSYLS